jgi:hypothetical protein
VTAQTGAARKIGEAQRRAAIVKGVPCSATISRSDGASTPAMLIDFHEIAERDRKDRFLGGRERIDAQPVFETRDQNGEAERVETAIRKHEIFFEGCENFSVLARYLFHLFDYG